MTDLESKRRALGKLDERLAAGEIAPAEYERLTVLLTAGLTEEQRRQLGVTPTPAGAHPPAPREGDTFFVDLPVGYELQGRYRIEGKIGQGGLGVVYRVADTRLSRALAIKLLPSLLSRDPAAVKLLETEVVNAGVLHHPHICSVMNLETDPASGVSFVLMELLEGASLRQVLEEHGRLPEPVVIEVARQAFAALEFAHASPRGVVHRDIKPENLYWVGYAAGVPLAEQKVNLKLLDFGISTRVQESMTRLTGYRGSGTAAYIAPEVLAGQPAGPATDVYALGITLYELLEGQPPFAGPDVSVVFHQHQHAEPRRCAGASEALWALIAGCLAKRPEERPVGWQELDRRGKTTPAPAPAAPVAQVFSAPDTAPGRHGEPLLPPAGVAPHGRWISSGGFRELAPDSRWYPKNPHPDQVAEAGRLGVPLAIEHVTTGIPLILIPGGQFWMGATPGDSEAFNDEKPRHRVTIGPFYIGITPVTQQQWSAVIAKNPSHFKGGDRPVESVSWEDAQGFLATVAGGLRLPSEAEWERAARGGTETRYWWGDEYRAGMANCDETKLGGRHLKTTNEVGQYPPNPFGLLDVLGNVWEWVQDAWHSTYEGAPADGGAWEKQGLLAGAFGAYRVLRGGSWYYDAGVCRVAIRFWDDPGDRGSHLGFRLARTAE